MKNNVLQKLQDLKSKNESAPLIKPVSEYPEITNQLNPPSAVVEVPPVEGNGSTGTVDLPIVNPNQHVVVQKPEGLKKDAGVEQAADHNLVTGTQLDDVASAYGLQRVTALPGNRIETDVELQARVVAEHKRNTDEAQRKVQQLTEELKLRISENFSFFQQEIDSIFKKENERSQLWDKAIKSTLFKTND